MLNWLTRRANRTARRAAAPKARRPALRLESLEPREVPAILIQVDYAFDNGFFANNPQARATMQEVAAELGNSINANLAAITPGGGNTWSASFYNPINGALTSVPNLALGANTIHLYVGGRAMGSSEAGFGGFGGYSISGSQAWISTVQTRGWGGFAPWGGSITFDTTKNWYFGLSGVVPSNQLDFYSVATHELGHVLGIGTANQWKNLVSGGTFHGGNAMAVYGAPVPVSADGAHWANGLTIGGVRASLDPVLNYGTRVSWSALDAAALRDIGWAPGTAAPTSPVPAPTPPAFTRVPVANLQPVGFAGGTDGTLTEYVLVNGVLTPNGQTFTPFIGYHGVLRIAGGDFNGDGFEDYVVANGPGPQSVIEIINGRDGSLLLNQTPIFPGFRGGLFVAAGDIDGDGKAELAVSADGGAGPHVDTFRVVGGSLVLQSSFFAFDNPTFSGGARVALGDINHDGFADLVVTTGGQAEGRVAIYSGAALRYGTATRLTGDFIPYVGFYGALNAAVGDMDGDGLAELALSPDQGTVAHIKIWSGASLVSGANPNNLPPIASFYAYPSTDPSGARLAMHDLDGDGRDELVVASGNPRNSAARVFNIAQAEAGGGGAPVSYPVGAVTINGLYAGDHTPANDTSTTAANQPADTAAPITVTVPAKDGYDPDAISQWTITTDELVPTVHVG
jgi:hypothetical protein